MSASAIETVLTWHAALHTANIDQLLSFCTPDVVIGGPRGVGHGTDLLRDWVARAGLDLEPGRIFGGQDVVVVEQAARWRSADGELGERQPVASVFRIQNGLISSVIRYADLEAALQAAGLRASAEVAPAPDRTP